LKRCFNLEMEVEMECRCGRFLAFHLIYIELQGLSYG